MLPHLIHLYIALPLCCGSMIKTTTWFASWTKTSEGQKWYRWGWCWLTTLRPNWLRAISLWSQNRKLESDPIIRLFEWVCGGGVNPALLPFITSILIIISNETSNKTDFGWKNQYNLNPIISLCTFEKIKP